MSDFISTLLNMSLVGTYCILVVLLLRLFLRKAPKVFTYILWGVVFLRLALPIFPEAPISLVPESVRNNPVTSYFSGTDNAGLIPPFTSITGTDSPFTQGVKAISNPPGDTQTTPLTNSQVSVSQESSVNSTPTTHLTVKQIALIVWCSGLALLTSYNLITYLLLRRRLTDAVMEDGVFITDKISSPFVLGFIHPRIYLPTGLTPEERSFIVLHEKAHLRRCDPVIKLLAFLITSLHWFNPFAWVAFLLFSRDIELTCDESVVRDLRDSERKEYSATLLSVASGRSLLRPMPLAFGDGDLKGRIKNILNYRKPGLWLISLAVSCVMIISVGLLMNPVHAEEISEIIEEVIETTSETESVPTTYETAESVALETSMTSESTTTPSETTVPTESTTVSSETTTLPEKSSGEWSESLYSWTAETPADFSSFESIFTKHNYTVSKIDVTDQADAVYQAIYPNGKSVITCTVYPNTDLSYRALDSYMVNMFKDFQWVPNGKVPLYCGNINYFAALDLPRSDSESVFCAAFLSGNILIEVNIPLDMKEIQPYMRAIQEYGMGDPVNIDGPMPEMPETASMCAPEELDALLSPEGFTVHKNEYMENVYEAESADGTLMIDLSPISSPEDWEYAFVTTLYDGGPTNILAYRKTESYRCKLYSSTYVPEYRISLEQNGWHLNIATDWSAAPEKEAELRALVDRLLLKLCFDNTALE